MVDVQPEFNHLIGKRFECALENNEIPHLNPAICSAELIWIKFCPLAADEDCRTVRWRKTSAASWDVAKWGWNDLRSEREHSVSIFEKSLPCESIRILNHIVWPVMGLNEWESCLGWRVVRTYMAVAVNLRVCVQWMGHWQWAPSDKFRAINFRKRKMARASHSRKATRHHQYVHGYNYVGLFSLPFAPAVIVHHYLGFLSMFVRLEYRAHDKIDTIRRRQIFNGIAVHSVEHRIQLDCVACILKRLKSKRIDVTSSPIEKLAAKIGCSDFCPRYFWRSLSTARVPAILHEPFSITRLPTSIYSIYQFSHRSQIGVNEKCLGSFSQHKKKKCSREIRTWKVLLHYNIKILPLNFRACERKKAQTPLEITVAFIYQNTEVHHSDQTKCWKREKKKNTSTCSFGRAM